MARREKVKARLELFQQKINRVSQSRYFLVSKWLVVLGALTLLAEVVSYQNIAVSLKQISPSTLILFLVIFFLSRVLYVTRWKLICGHSLSLPPFSYGFLLRVHLLGELGAILFCSSGAGEIFRISKLANKTGVLGLSTLSVAIDRLFSVTGILLLVLIFSPQISFPSGETIPWPDGTAWLAIILLAGFSAIGLWFGLKKGIGLLRMHGLNFTWPIFVKLLLLTLGGHLLFASSYYLLIHQLHPSQYPAVLALVFVSQLAKIIPVSLLGVGGGEASLLALAYLAGISSEEILVVIGVAVLSLYLLATGGLLAELLVDGQTFVRNSFHHLGKTSKE